ncbi:MAG: CocE/NonD family hydrolase [Gammaproteobacteria bacterium]
MKITVEKNVAIEMRDGIKLRADIYRPAADGNYPTLLQRTPYNKELWPITALTLDPVRAAEAGFAVVIQDVRARWASEGDVFFPYRDEEQDGYDTIEWLTKQDFSDGQVGCYGLSYMGGTSWLAAASGHRALKAISPTTAPNDFWRNHFWRGGVLNIGTLAMWALRAIGPAALMRAKPNTAEMYPMLVKLFDQLDEFGEMMREVPLDAFPPAFPDDDSVVPFFFEFLRHPVPDEWTKQLLFANRHDQVTVPSLTIAGWHDLLLAADLEHFQGMKANAGSEQARHNSKLIVGPWAHGMFQHVVGEVDFGFRSNGMFLDLKEDLTKLQVRWFARWLQGEQNGVEDEAPVKIFVQGLNRWRDEQEWPLKREVRTKFYLQEKQALSKSVPSRVNEPDNYIYDPNDPCPTCGGNTLLPPQYTPGPINQAPLLHRRDVLQYTSAVLPQNTEVTGNVVAKLFASTSGTDTDWMIKLCDVHADGNTYNVCDGVIRAAFRNGHSLQPVTPNEVFEYDIDLWSTSYVFKAGHRIRILITSSDFPRYDRNPNTGEAPQSATNMSPAVQQIHHSVDRASFIELPIIPA